LNGFPCVSEFEDAETELRYCYLNGVVELPIRKERDPITLKHNFSQIGYESRAGIETDEAILIEAKWITEQVMKVTKLRFSSVDILVSKSGLKVLELSIPNVGRFSESSPENRKAAKDLYKKALLSLFQK
jgi:hypothetical protein